MSRALAQRDEATARLHLKEGARFGLLLIAPVATLLSVDADRVVTLLFGSGYAPAGNILRWQLIAFALLPLLDLCFMALAADGRPAYPAWFLAALIAPAAGLCLALVNSHGGVGAAAAQVIVVAIGTALAALATWRRFWDAPGATYPTAGRLRDRLNGAGLRADFGRRPMARGEVRRSVRGLGAAPRAAERAHSGGSEAAGDLEPQRCVTVPMSRASPLSPACRHRPRAATAQGSDMCYRDQYDDVTGRLKS